MTDAKQQFNEALRSKVAGKSPEKKADPEELVERAGAAMAELQDVIAELAGVTAEAGEEEKTK